MATTIDASDRHGMFYWQVDRPFDARQTKEIFLDRHEHFDKNQAVSAIEAGMISYGLSSSDSRVVKIYDVISFGSVNVVLKATLASGLEVIFRMHPSGLINGYFWVERTASMKAKCVGVPSYDTYCIDDSMMNFPFAYMLIECLPGENMQSTWPLAKTREVSLLKKTGAYLAKIHSVRTEKYGFFDNGLAKRKGMLIGILGSWRDHILASFQVNLKYLVDNAVIPFTDSRRIERLFSGHDGLLTNINPCLVQNDLADWNQLIEGCNVTGIIDWDECYSGDPVADFSAWSVFFPFERMEHLMDGYRQVSPLPAGYEEKLHLYRVRYIVSKSVSRHMKLAFYRSTRYQSMLDYALSILSDEFAWYGI